MNINEIFNGKKQKKSKNNLFESSNMNGLFGKTKKRSNDVVSAIMAKPKKKSSMMDMGMIKSSKKKSSLIDMNSFGGKSKGSLFSGKKMEVKLPSMSNMKKTMGGFGMMTPMQKKSIKDNKLSTNLFLNNDKGMVPLAMDCNPFKKRKHNAEQESEEVEEEEEKKEEMENMPYRADPEDTVEEANEKAEGMDKTESYKIQEAQPGVVEVKQAEKDTFFGNIGRNVKRRAKQLGREAVRDISKAAGYVDKTESQQKELMKEDIKTAASKAYFYGASKATVEAISKNENLSLKQREKALKRLAMDKKTTNELSRLKSKREAAASFYKVRKKQAEYKKAKRDLAQKRVMQPARSSGLVSYMKGGFRSDVAEENENFSKGDVNDFFIVKKKQ